MLYEGLAGNMRRLAGKSGVRPNQIRHERELAARSTAGADARNRQRLIRFAGLALGPPAFRRFLSNGACVAARTPDPTGSIRLIAS